MKKKIFIFSKTTSGKGIPVQRLHWIHNI